MSKRIVIALGGNAILQSKQKGTAEEQRANVHTACMAVADLVEAGNQVIVTHGNGPQVGAVLLQNEIAKEQVPAMPLDLCGAATQGQIGYMIQQSLTNILAERALPRPVVSLVTQVLVDENDAAFKHPTKPIGSFYTAEEAARFSAEKSWVMREDKARGGWRRVVPSPDPIRIVERAAIRALLDAEALVISSGGGGIPVVERAGKLQGVEAVIDKDLAGERLACDVEADTLMILTDVSEVALHFNTPDQVNLRCIALSEAKRYYGEGHFKAGSMGPKMLAAIRFLEDGGERSIITSLEMTGKAVQGLAGTIITRTGEGYPCR
ncbi:MAG: Carbamate kinase 2 [Firmicutes bacterium]|nr:Carbamate kinase 2 [candidate division NPL-UPA2 bacterium]